jgi:hypothetical protein
VTVNAKLAAWPALTVLVAGEAATVKSGATTTILTGFEVLAELLGSPSYMAVTE